MLPGSSKRGPRYLPTRLAKWCTGSRLRVEHCSDAIVLRVPEGPDGAGPLPRTLRVVVYVGGAHGVPVAQPGNPHGTLEHGPLDLPSGKPLQEHDPAARCLGTVDDRAQRDQVDTNGLTVPPLAPVTSVRRRTRVDYQPMNGRVAEPSHFVGLKRPPGSSGTGTYAKPPRWARVAADVARVGQGRWRMRVRPCLLGVPPSGVKMA